MLRCIGLKTKTLCALATFTLIGSYVLFLGFSFYPRLSGHISNKSVASQMHDTQMKNFTTIGLRATENAVMVKSRHMTEKGITLDKRMRNCSRGEELVGPLYVNKASFDWDELKEEYSFVEPGGFYAPTHCHPTAKTAIIIPYRDRVEMLKIFLRQLHPILRRQQLQYQIFVIDQADDNLFNRGKLMNVGFKESLKYGDFSCFIFHDVDLIPEDDRNFYGCNISPAHMSVAVDKFNYRLLYSTLFGGVVMFTREDFITVNGFSNIFWGWGAEDDDLYRRIGKNGLVMKRPPIEIARYTMLKHEEQPKSDERFQRLRDANGNERADGLNSLNYSIKARTKHKFYTIISVDLLKEAE